MDSLLKPITIFIIFGLFHSVSAQTFFKDFLKRVTSPFFVNHFWRLIYVLVSLQLLFTYFYPSLQTAFANNPLIYDLPSWCSFISQLGLWIFYLSLVQIDFLEYIGLRQLTRGMIYLIMKDKKYLYNEHGKKNLQTWGLYGVVRHPAYAGLLIYLGFGDRYLSDVFTILLFITYLIIGTYFEELRLIKIFGREYTHYKKRVPAFIPGLKIKLWKQ